MVSPERTYQYVRADKAQGGDLYQHLRHKLKHQKRPVGAQRIKIKDRVDIAQRPPIVDQRTRFDD